MSGSKTVIGFDLYGTLLSTESIAKDLSLHFGDEKAQSLAVLWRRFQLEYTWRLNSMSTYKPFSDITNASLKHALAESGLSLSDSAIEGLMRAYDSLETFPDVALGLESLASEPAIAAYVFSNGTDAMVSSSVTQSPSLSRHASVFKGLVTVGEIEAYKPDARTYRHLAERAGKGTSKADLATIWLVSGNPFDVVGARSAGLQAAWVNRAGGHHGNEGWTDGLGGLMGVGPTVIVNGVDEAVGAIRNWTVARESRASGAAYNKSEAALGPR